MKKIINGKKYNTDTATLVACAGYGSGGDIKSWDEDLYITKKNNWFIHGKGGPNSQYAVQIEQNQWSGSEDIIPFTDEEAMYWLEMYNETNKIEEYFNNQIEDA